MEDKSEVSGKSERVRFWTTAWGMGDTKTSALPKGESSSQAPAPGPSLNWLLTDAHELGINTKASIL